MVNFLVENLMMGLVVVSALASISKNPNCSIALMFSLMSGLYFSSVGEFYYHYHMMFFCIFLCVLTYENGSIKAYAKADNNVAYAVAFLYVPRMVVGFTMLNGWISLETSWIASTILLALQCVLVLAGAFNGSGKRVDYAIARVSNSYSYKIFHNPKI